MILLDVNMPEMDGFETAALIRERKRSEHTPIIFVTAFNDDVQIAKGYSLGAVDFISTPIDPEVLRTKVGVSSSTFSKRPKRFVNRLHIGFNWRVSRLPARLQKRRCAARRCWPRQAGYYRARSISTTRSQVCTGRWFPRSPMAVSSSCTTRTWISGLPTWQRTTRRKWQSFQLAFAHRASRSEIGRRGGRSSRKWSCSAIEPEVVGNAPDLGPKKKWSSAVVVPLIARDTPLGAIVCCLLARRQFEPADFALIENLASRAATALDNAQLFQTIRDGERRKDEFLAMLGHELRNPLAAITNAGELTNLLDPGDATFDESLEIIRQQASLMKRLVDDLLDVSRITSGRVQLQKSLWMPPKLSRASPKRTMFCFPRGATRCIWMLRHKEPCLKPTPTDWSRSFRTCWSTRRSTPIRAAKSGSVPSAKGQTSCSAFAIRVSASAPICCRMYSIYSHRPIARCTGPRAVWASV